MDGATDAVSTHVVGIGMDRAVGIVAVIVTVEIAEAVTVARVIAAAVIVAKHVSGRMAAAVVVAIAMENGGHAAIDPLARKHKGIAARVRDGAMEVGVTAIAATGIVLKVLVATATAVMGIGVISTAPREIAATGIVRRADALTATVQTAAVVTAIVVTSIVTPTVEVTSLARRPPNRLKAFGRMTRAIVSQTLRCHWPAARVMLA
jgi:hypothetical protein